jgi:general secretion pathway protein N
MSRLGWCIVLVLLLKLPLYAEEAPPNDESALPWLRLDELSATRDRPLFAPDRRKNPAVSALPLNNAPEEKDEPKQAKKPQLVLTGIIVSSSSETIALLRDNNTSESFAVRSGETIGRWRVLVETNHSVKLQDGAREVELEMFPEP